MENIDKNKLILQELAQVLRNALDRMKNDKHSSKNAVEAAPIKKPVRHYQRKIQRNISTADNFEQIKVALNVALKCALVKKSEKIVERMARVVQMMMRDRQITLLQLVESLSVPRRTIQLDVALLKRLGVIDRIGPDNGGKWDVRLTW